jgi:hypothetical protein
MPERGELPEFLGITEGHNLQRNGQVHGRLAQHCTEYSSHLLEFQGSFPSAFFPSIGHHRKMRRVHLDPLRLARGSEPGQAE